MDKACRCGGHGPSQIATAPSKVTAEQMVEEAARHPGALEVMQRLGINRCCGAGLTLTEAAASAGVPLPALQTRAGKEVVLELLGRGEPFGGVAVLERRPYPASTQAAQVSLVLKIPCERIVALSERHPAIIREMALMIGRRLRAGGVGDPRRKPLAKGRRHSCDGGRSILTDPDELRPLAEGKPE